MYLKVADVPLETYNELGFSDEAKEGAIPSENEFLKTIGRYWQRNKRKKSFNIIQFKELVSGLYYGLREKIESGKVKENLGPKLESAKAKVSALEQLVQKRHELIMQLASRPDDAAAALAAERGLHRPLVTFSEGDSSLVRRDPLKGLDGHIKALQTANKEDRAYKEALMFAQDVLTSSMSRIRDDLHAAKQDLARIEGKIQSIGTKQKTKIYEIKPVINSPLVDPESLMKALDDAFVTHTREEQQFHPYAWLDRPDFLKMLFENLENLREDGQEDDLKPPAPGTLRYKTDIIEVRPKIVALVGGFRTFATSVKNRITEINNGIKEESHMLSSVTKDEFNALKNIRNTLEERHGENFKALIEYDVNVNDFVVPDVRLAPELLPVRNQLRKLEVKIQELRDKNREISKQWDSHTKYIDLMRNEIANIKKLYNVVGKEDYFRLWMRGDIPVELPLKSAAIYDVISDIVMAAGTYQDPGKDFAVIRELVSDLKKLVDEHELTKGDAETTRNLLKSGEAWKYLDAVQDTLTKINTKMMAYFEKVDNFLVGLMTGRSLVKQLEETETKQARADKYRRYAAMIFIAEAVDAPPVEMPIKDPAPGEISPRPTKDPDLHSEMPMKLLRIINPLQPNVYYDYFQQSFPAEKIWNEWFRVSGGTHTLKPDKFPELVDRLWTYTQKDFHSDDAKKNLESERGKLEDKLNKTIEERKGTFEKLNKARTWAIKVTGDLDREFDSNESISAASKEKIDSLKEAIGKGDTEFIEALKAKDYTKCKEIDKKLTSLMDDVLKLVRINATSLANAQTAATNVGEARDTWAEVGMRLLNRIHGSQDTEYKLNNQIIDIDNALEDVGKPEADLSLAAKRQKARNKNLLALYVWNVLDNNWMTDPAAFQTIYNVGFEDYVDIHDAVEKFTGQRVLSRALGRIKKDIMEKVQEYRRRKMPIPESLKEELDFLKGRGGILRSADDESVTLYMQSSVRVADNYACSVGEIMADESVTQILPSHVRVASAGAVMEPMESTDSYDLDIISR